MKTSLDYLPEHKQAELRQITDLILKELEPEMVILFGSYATNKWVEDKYVEDGITYEYKSDFDILVISKVELGPRRINKWHKLEDEVRKLPLTTPVSLIHHGIKFINKELRKNSYFFMDIVKEGVLLFDSKNFELDKPKKLNEEQLKNKAKEDFEQWFKSASMFYEDFESNFQKGEKDLDYYKNAAFLLHQSTERFYTAFLLVYTGYRPKTHDIQKLGEMAVTINEKLKTVFPRTTTEDRKRFDLLKRAYIDARYKKDYTINKEELDYLSRKVKALRELVGESCKQKLI